MKLKFLKKLFRRKKPLEQGGAILDRVISQSTSTATVCLLYKLANYKRGGDLIDAFQIGGQMAVEQLIREQFGVFMYQSGKGQVINRAEYLRWKYMDNHEVTIPIEASLSPHDPLGKWLDHKACWQMQYRGSLGESLLHVLIICDTKIHTKLARILLRVFPQQSIDVMEGEDYLGASALHLAIAYSNNELVQDLIEAGADVNQRAIGSFFLPRDQQRYKPAKNSDYEGLAYMGEYPLAWAACCANESVYNLLLDNNADPNAQDTFGNMILHMVVVCDKLDMFGYALRHPKLPAKNGMLNTSGLTPLTLACKLGRAEVFREMLELSSREFWRYSNITCSGYPLNALDTLMPDGSTNWNSALFIILNGTKEEHLDMLDGGIIQRLLEEKWKTFARRQFLKRLLILFIHLFCMSCSIYLRPSSIRRYEKNEDEEVDGASESSSHSPSHNEHDIVDENDVSQIIRYCSECATIIGVLSYVIFQQGDEMKNQGVCAFLKQLSHDPAKSIFLISNLMILACIPFRIIGDIETEEAILVFAVPGSWFLLMFFAGAVRLTGPFVTMIYSMITGDMLTFGIIYTIVLFGFSQAFFFLYKGHPNLESTPFHTYYSTWMALFQTTLGDYNYADLNNTSYPNLGKTVFVIFMIFVPILLLNMLIAMMGNTYAHVIEQSEKEWMKQWAKIVVTLERAVSQQDAKKYLEDYSISLGPSDDPRYEQRGVMVIKSKSKTRAKQRKGAVSNWKRVGKVTLNALKKRGMTGEQLRRVMWGRQSITSPTRITKKKPNTLNDPFGLTTAIDGMSFTHDIIMCGGDDQPGMHATIEIPGDKNNKKKKIQLKKMPTGTYNPVLAGQNAMFPIRPGQIDGKDLLMSNKLQQELDQKVYNDPLRELVLISEAFVPRDNQYYNNMLLLARNATALDHVQEVKIVDKLAKKSASAEIEPPITMAANIGQQIQMFQNPNEIVDPVKEREFLRTLEALDDTDNEMSERPVLGKISLIRRAKSAVSRTSSGKRKTSEHPLFLMAWDEVRPQKQTAWTENAVEAGFENHDEIIDNDVVNSDFEVADNQENESVPVDAEDPAAESFPETFEQENETVDAVVVEEENEIVTVEDVRRRMEQFHQHRKSSADSESTDRERKKKYSTKRQTNGKFTKNRISPESSVVKEDNAEKASKRGKSAPAREFRRHIEGEMADPLENWSTKNIMNINQLLEMD